MIIDIYKKIRILGLAAFTLTIIFSLNALIFSITIPPVYGQTTNAWNLQRSGAGNDLNIYYNNGSNQPTALQLNVAGDARVRRLLDLDDPNYFLNPNGTSNLNVLTATGAVSGASGTFPGGLSMTTNGSMLALPNFQTTTSYSGIGSNYGNMPDGVPWYMAFGREPGATWASPYPNLLINNHTGIVLSSHGGFTQGGVAIYEELNAAGTNWQAKGKEVARFKHNDYGGSYVNGKFNVTGTLTAPGAIINISLAYCGGACNGYHAPALNSWYNVSNVGYSWSTQINTAPEIYTPNGAGTITVAKAGLYQIKITSMAIPNSDQQNVVSVLPCINGGATGSAGNNQYTHGYHKAAWWAQETHEFTLNLSANTAVQYCYLYSDPAGLAYWAHDGFTAMEIVRIN